MHLAISHQVDNMGTPFFDFIHRRYSQSRFRHHSRCSLRCHDLKTELGQLLG